MMVDNRYIDNMMLMINTGLILALRLANERRRYFVTTSLIGSGQT